MVTMPDMSTSQVKLFSYYVTRKPMVQAQQLKMRKEKECKTHELPTILTCTPTLKGKICKIMLFWFVLFWNYLEI